MSLLSLHHFGAPSHKAVGVRNEKTNAFPATQE
jgi:hypothetical protein